MQKTILLASAAALSGACAMAAAQTPAVNAMPDGSRDMYVGLGLQSGPRYEGSRRTRDLLLPTLQIEWSNGMFIAGQFAGLHLSSQPGLEYGPLLSLHPGRSERGGTILLSQTGASDVDVPTHPAPIITVGQGFRANAAPASLSPLVLPLSLSTAELKIPARLEAGGFFNYYLARELRLTNSVLYGAGRARHGLRWIVEVQRMSTELAPHHRLALAAGVTVVNRDYGQEFFGIPGAAGYRPGGGLKDVHASLRWTWELSPAWLLSSVASVSSLRGDYRRSPWTQRASGGTVSISLAYRF